MKKKAPSPDRLYGGWRHVERFLAHLRTERRLSEHTANNYERDLLALAKFCTINDIAAWSQLDSQHTRLFAARQHAQGLSPRSIQRRLSAVRTFFEYLVRETLAVRGNSKHARAATPNVHRNPAHEIRAPKAAKRLPHTLDADQMASLLDFRAADSLSARDKAIMELLYSSGLRLQELVSLDVGDLDLADRTVRVTGKGDKMRIAPVGRVAVSALEGWLRERTRLSAAGERALFVGRNGRRLGARAVQKRVDYWAQRRGLGVKTHPHLFRHSFATHLLESSRDLRGVQELLGHANISTTQVYTHLDFQHLARIYDASHPRARRQR
jgi:integrase/recombinase XerC